MATFNFELVSPERLLFAGPVEQVVVPGAEGDFAVLKDHAPLMSSLRPGVIVVTDDKNQTQRLFVRGGFADVSPSGLTILAEQAVPVQEITDEFIAVEVKAAEDEFAAASTEDERRVSQERLAQVLALRDQFLSRTHVQ
ncbi:F0F1 ATP synthase subunit epsilon [Alsobacter sp. SYSU M60028]|uniref:ATP synthase epsilon chain n=1 Tax=Alsobacter ponti TaxID=2962936 RepID=A0ABT1LG60_9HYPH|nr:F0F1 ATP synthase subunit epsilon [Alsobacter ponti]MCP8940486.1 F0F1 ATP synthase subunit epsilon [Alsobacter ponti]